MKPISIITGGGSGMGLATAKVLGMSDYIIIVGRTQKKLTNALQELQQMGIEAETFACDISDRNSVNKLFAHAKRIGKIRSVIHAAGMSPNMGDAKTIMEVNALGTININNACFEALENGACIVDVSSMAGNIAPQIILPRLSYKYSHIDTKKFMRKMMRRVNLFPKKLKSEVAYAISKNFVTWFALSDAARFGAKGIRVVCVSPGMFDTPMGALEQEEAEKYIRKYAAVKRMGDVDEIANLLAFCVSDKTPYLTGVDIICDGGCIAGRKVK
ncbi:MAG: SDR family oxidoreductase [Bacteroidales bacterium]|jgi:NAD(P)-dependent dehydrogenase (short-subunit alcohol dehydrogenase family)|nr:SDR family oxidoreductase [Bacteroidales bacterium]